jgi:ribosomal protein S18 acetylase RimI-like enzyme
VSERIDSVDEELAPMTKALVREYATFLRVTQSCGTPDFAKFEEEIEALPEPYAGRGGEVLLLRVDGVAAGCIAYRAVADGCEIKRLYVAPAFRSRGLARKLVVEAMVRATARGFTRAELDTDVGNMGEALRLYLGLGFKEFRERAGNLAFLERVLG